MCTFHINSCKSREEITTIKKMSKSTVQNAQYSIGYEVLGGCGKSSNTESFQNEFLVNEGLRPAPEALIKGIK